MFAAEHGIPRSHPSYDALVHDPDIDIIYVATPHHLHVQHGVLAMEAGKHVLIEKPMALTVEGIERLFEVAARNGVMCQEGFWSFFLPKFDVIRHVLDEGWLGPLTTVVADHGEWLPPEHRIHEPALAGGSLHDLGVYVFAWSVWATGPAQTVRAVGQTTESGVVGDVAIALTSAEGATACLSTTMMATTPCRGVLAGERGTLETDGAFFCPGPFTVTDTVTGERMHWNEPNVRHEALYFEAAEVARCIHAGQTLSSMWTPQNSRDVAAALTAVNAELGLTPADA